MQETGFMNLQRCVGHMFGNSMFLLIGFMVTPLTAQITTAEYANLQTEFQSLHGAQTFFPVAGKTTDDVESTFGPRIQHTTGLYDFHRGIDVDGTQGEDILAVTGGVFWEHRTFDRGGLTVILRHDFSNPMTLNGNSYDHYFTYYMHLFDDQTQGNGVGTLDVINGWVSEKSNPGQGTSISAGTHIGELGSSGSSGGQPYSDHLHMEVRAGTTNSLIFQTDNPATTQHGFDPHLHPMLFYQSAIFGGLDNSPTLTAQSALTGSSDFEVAYESSDKALLLNRLEISLIDPDTNAIIDSHLLDFSLREGFDASDQGLLDTQDLLLPYIDPESFGQNSETFTSNIVIPATWMATADGQFELQVEAYDIWGNVTQFGIASVPEPAIATLIAALLLPVWAAKRRRHLLFE
jgi:murein DD-endopeptidase MepM/ murein hydrolase activator NlpD